MSNVQLAFHTYVPCPRVDKTFKPDHKVYFI